MPSLLYWDSMLSSLLYNAVDTETKHARELGTAPKFRTDYRRTETQHRDVMSYSETQPRNGRYDNEIQVRDDGDRTETVNRDIRDFTETQHSRIASVTITDLTDMKTLFNDLIEQPM